jgi:hypothetical protein
MLGFIIYDVVLSLFMAFFHGINDIFIGIKIIGKRVSEEDFDIFLIANAEFNLRTVFVCAYNKL